MVNVVKPLASILAAALSVTSSAYAYNMTATLQQMADNLVSISQSTAQISPDDSFLSQDYLGTVLTSSMITAISDQSSDFTAIASLCNQDISAAHRRASVANEISSRSGMFGRLVIPGAGIDVALIIPSSPSRNQAVTDAKDSACLMLGQHSADSKLIADHNNQAFRNLSSVTPGMSAYIITADGIINLTCSTAINGHNTTYEITDLNYNSVADIADYVCYTCQDSWRNVRVVGFNVV